jgi:raffinose/stachyose/melibiose transport system permease protein
MSAIRIRRALGSVPGSVILVVLAVVALLPIFLVLVNSVKTQAQITANPLALPTAFDLTGFARAFEYGNFATGIPNSLLLTATTIVIVLVTATPAAYVLSRGVIRTGTLVSTYFLMAITVPVQLMLFPLYAALAALGLLNNVIVVGVVLAALNLPLSILLLRTYFEQIPFEIIEAATVDGAGTVGVLWHILFPIVRPGVVTVSIIVGLNAWNEFLISSTLLQKEPVLTAPLGFLTMNGPFSTDLPAMMAGAALLIVPIAVLLVAGQRFIVDGLASSAVKG